MGQCEFKQPVEPRALIGGTTFQLHGSELHGSNEKRSEALPQVHGREDEFMFELATPPLRIASLLDARQRWDPASSSSN